jgi:hypothetical protein
MYKIWNQLLVFIILNKTCDEITDIKENYAIDFRCQDTLYQVSYKIDDEKIRLRESSELLEDSVMMVHISIKLYLMIKMVILMMCR